MVESSIECGSIPRPSEIGNYLKRQVEPMPAREVDAPRDGDLERNGTLGVAGTMRNGMTARRAV